MNLFENLQNFNESNTFESNVDYNALKDNNIDFFENGAGVYRVTTPDGDTLDIDIELSNSPTDIPKYFVSLPSEDVKTVNVDLTTAIIDVINKLSNPPTNGLGKKHIKVTESKDNLWTKFSNHYNGFVPVQDMSNYFSLDQFSEFVNWARKEADLDTDMEKLYDNWDDAFEALNEINGDPENEVDSISVENIFNFFSTSDLEEFWSWVETEYDLIEDELDESKNVKTEAVSTEDAYRRIEYIRDALDTLESFVNKESSIPDNVGNILKQIYHLVDYIYEYTDTMKEATSGIGGAYTTKAIDMIPTGVKKVNENLYDEYLERVMNEKSNVELVNLLHEIRDNKKLKAEDKKKLEDEIRTKVRSIKTEAITEFYGKEWTDEEIKKAIEVAKENPEAVGYIDPDECASPFNYNGKTYYAVGEGKEIAFDGKDCVVFLTADEELNRYLSYFEVSYEDEGDGESGPQEPTMTFASDIPYKVVEV